MAQTGETSGEDDVQLHGVPGHLASCSGRGGGVQLHELSTFKPISLFKNIRFFGTDSSGLQYSSLHTWRISKVVIPGSHSPRLGINCTRVSAGHWDFKISSGASYVQLRLKTSVFEVRSWKE